MPVELHLDHEPNALGGYHHDHHHDRDQHDNAAPAALHPHDTLGASAPGLTSQSPELTHQQQQQQEDLSSHQSSDQPPSPRQFRPESVPAHALPSQAAASLYSPRSTRSHSLAASLASVSQSPIRRKPLSPTASSVAVRFSSKGLHMLPQDLSQPPESGYFSLDSPDLYDLSQGRNTSELAAPAPLPTPLETESEDE